MARLECNWQDLREHNWQDSWATGQANLPSKPASTPCDWFAIDHLPSKPTIFLGENFQAKLTRWIYKIILNGSLFPRNEVTY